MARVRQFAKDMGMSYNQAKNLVNKGRKLKDGGSSVLESTMNKVKPVMASNGKFTKTEKDPEKKNELRQKAHAFRNNSQYADARQELYDKEDKLVDQFHNSKIQPGQFVNDGSDEYKELEKMFNTLLSLRKIEDQEQFLTKDQEKAIRVAQSLANDPTRRSFQRDPQKEINKAYGDVMKKIAKKIKNIDI